MTKEPLLIFVSVFIYTYITIFTHIYIYDTDDYKSLGSHRTLLAFLWPILFVRKLVDLFVWIYNGIKEIFKFIVK